MKGFDPEFADLPDYILKITKQIWEDRGLSRIRDYYAPNCPVRSPAGIVTGNEAVIAATAATLAEFPDRELLGEDVIWCGDEDAGFLSSHRLYSTATHLGHGAYGEPTGRRLRYHAIADCACRDNQVYDEWLVRDQGAIVRQLGIEPKRYAAERIAAEGGPEGVSLPFTPEQDVDGGYHGRGNEHPAGRRYADLLTRIMGAEMSAISDVYDRAVQLALPGGVRTNGEREADRFWMEVRAALPSARFTIEHVIGREDPALPPRAACRWSLTGKHEGFGAFGAPSGAEIHVMAISHAEFGPRGLNREWVLFDETAIWKQILLKTG